ncbi:MAG: rRNA maturation RNase YbeY [Cryomorphaceae bacterium]
MEAYLISENDAFVPTANDERVMELLTDVLSKSEKVEFGEVAFIVMTDADHTELNIRYLDHDYSTDILTFDLSFDELISADVCINWEVCLQNAEHFQVSDRAELYRLFAHGMLHLAGYDDSTERERAKMRQREDYYLQVIRDKGFM